MQALDAADAVFLRVGLHHFAVGIDGGRRQHLVPGAVEVEHRRLLQLFGRIGRLEHFLHEGSDPAHAIFLRQEIGIPQPHRRLGNGAGAELHRRVFRALKARIALRRLPPFGFGLRVDLLGVEIEIVDAAFAHARGGGLVDGGEIAGDRSADGRGEPGRTGAPAEIAVWRVVFRQGIERRAPG